jgi:hypothetical protein
MGSKRKTHNAGAVTATEMTVAIGRCARTVGPPGKVGISCSADIPLLESSVNLGICSRECGDHGRSQGWNKSDERELHGGLFVDVWIS